MYNNRQGGACCGQQSGQAFRTAPATPQLPPGVLERVQNALRAAQLATNQQNGGRPVGIPPGEIPQDPSGNPGSQQPTTTGLVLSQQAIDQLAAAVLANLPTPPTLTALPTVDAVQTANSAALVAPDTFANSAYSLQYKSDDLVTFDPTTGGITNISTEPLSYIATLKASFNTVVTNPAAAATASTVFSVIGGFANVATASPLVGITSGIATQSLAQFGDNETHNFYSTVTISKLIQLAPGESVYPVEQFAIPIPGVIPPGVTLTSYVIGSTDLDAPSAATSVTYVRQSPLSVL